VCGVSRVLAKGRMCDRCKAERRRLRVVRRTDGSEERAPEAFAVAILNPRIERYAAIVASGGTLFEDTR